MASPLRSLIIDVKAMREAAGESKKSHDSFAANVLPDIFEAAANLLQTIISPNTGKILENNDKRADEVDQMLLLKENEFVHRIEEKINHVVAKVDFLNAKYQELNKAYLKSMDEIAHKHERQVKEFIESEEKENNRILDEWEEERQELLAQERKIYQKIELKIAETVGIISEEYKTKIAEIEKEIQSHQTILQNTIHQKHSQPQTKADLIHQEERRMAQEHEEITKKFQERRLQIDQDIE